MEEEQEEKAPTLTPEAIEKIRAEQREKAARDKKRILDPSDPFYLAGLLTFGEGDFEKFTPRHYDGLPEGKRPIYHIRPYGKKHVRAIDAARTPEALDAAIIAGLQDGALIEWENRTTRGGKVIAFDKEAIDAIPTLDLRAIHDHCYAYATGILPEEAEGLG